MSKIAFTEDEIRAGLVGFWTLKADPIIRSIKRTRLDKQAQAALAEMHAAAAASKEATDNPDRETLEQRLSAHSAFMKAQARFDAASKTLDRVNAAIEQLNEEGRTEDTSEARTQ